MIYREKAQRLACVVYLAVWGLPELARAASFEQAIKSLEGLSAALHRRRGSGLELQGDLRNLPGLARKISQL